MDGLGQDLRLAVRSLAATPIVTAVAVLSLALGSGANTAIFSLIHSILIHSLPVPSPERLVLVSTSASLSYRPQYSQATFEAIRRHGDAFEGVAAYNIGKSTLAIGGESRSGNRLFVSGDFFATLGVPPLFGRTLTSADDVPGGGPVGVISYRFWRERFNGPANAVGTVITVDRVPVTIVGITPPDFFGLEVGRGFDIALPLRTASVILQAFQFREDTAWLNILLRMKPGQSLAIATSALGAVQPQIRVLAMPKPPAADFLKDPLTLQPVGRGTSAIRDRLQRPLWILFVVAALVLLIACANIANLLAARGKARMHDASVRVALGASRWRLARQYLVESLVLAGAGAALGLVFARWASRMLVTQLSTADAPVVLDLALDWRVLAFTMATLALTVVFSGFAPAVRGTRVPPIRVLKEHGRGASDVSVTRLSSGLLVGQVAISLVLVFAAGLFVRTFDHLARAPLGFDRDRVLVASVTAPTVRAVDRNVLYHRLVGAAREVPGIVDAGGSLNPPLIGRLLGDLVVSRPGAAAPSGAERISQSNQITPGWFATYSTPIRAGRDIDDHDTATSAPVMLVSEAFVRRYFPDRPSAAVGTALALTLRIPPIGDFPLGSRTIVGVVGDSVYRSVRDTARPAIYYPLAQISGPLQQPAFHIALRARSGAPTQWIASLSVALMAVNPDLVVTYGALSAQVDDALTEDRVVAVLSGFFGALALVSSGLGLYGTTAYAVERRRAEIGIRIALGATAAAVVRLVVSRMVILLGIGVAIGSGLSFWASTFVASLLYGVQPRDPSTLVGAAATLMVVGVAAAWFPVRRASKIDPAVILRES